MKTKFSSALSLALIVAMLVTSFVLAYVGTDQADYAPGSVVTIFGDNSDGAGFLAGEAVHVDVWGPNGYTAACDATADENGAWSCQVTLWDSLDAVGDYAYTATGLSSGVSQNGAFADSVSSVAITSPTGASPLTVTSLPATVTIAFDYSTSASGSTSGEASVQGVASNTKSLVSGSSKSDSIDVIIPAGTANGSFTVKVTVTNNFGTGANNGVDTKSNAVIVNVSTNTAPIANANGPYSVPEGGSTTLDGSGSSDSDGTIMSYEWDLNYDGVTFDVDASGVSPTFSAVGLDGPSTRTVALRVTDDDGAISTVATATVNITNVAPTAALGNGGAVNEGSAGSVSFSSQFDPSNADTIAGFTYSYDFDNDGTFEVTVSSSASEVVPASYLADGPGSRTVRARIADKDGDFTDYTTTITINNVAPSVSALTLGNASAVACLAGNTVTLDFSFSDLGVNDNPWAVDIDWGDGSHTMYNVGSQGAQTQQSHTFGVGSFMINVSVIDKDNGAGSSSSLPGAVSFLYNMSGILEPVNSSGTSVFKYGSTVPVKVRITDCIGTPVPGLAPTIGWSQSSSLTPSDGVNETASTSAADTTGIMRYSDGIYIYNFATKYLPDSNATYYFYVRESHSNPGQVSQKFGVRSK